MDEMDKAGKNYWDNCWSGVNLPRPIDPHDNSLSNYVTQRLHQYFSKLFSEMETRDKKLLEIGCARSVWLPYFGREFGFSVSGIDYSEIGCQQAEMILSNSKVDGKIVCSDFFTPPDSLLNSFDVVISFGVMEHFKDTEACLSAFSNFLLPDGMIITLIPNMAGMIGILQKILDKQTYEIHVPLDKKDIVSAHEKLRLNVLECEYFLPTNFGVLNVANLNKQLFSTKIKQFTSRRLSSISKLINFVDKKITNLPPTFLFSPYIICVAQKRPCGRGKMYHMNCS